MIRRIDSVSVLVRPPYNSLGMFEEVPSRALFPRAGVTGPTRRSPHAGPRHPLCSGSRTGSKQGRDVTRAPVLRSISRTLQPSVSLSCLSEGRRGSAGVRVSVGQHKLGRGEGGGMHVMSARRLLMTLTLLSADGHYVLLRCPSAPGFSNVNHPSICSPRHRSCAALAEGFERAQRVGLQGDRSREGPGAPRTRRGLPTPLKAIKLGRGEGEGL
jgi:hypothetical protein